MSTRELKGLATKVGIARETVKYTMIVVSSDLRVESRNVRLDSRPHSRAACSKGPDEAQLDSEQEYVIRTGRSSQRLSSGGTKISSTAFKLQFLRVQLIILSLSLGEIAWTCSTPPYSTPTRIMESS